jgi:hypothetical protein
LETVTDWHFALTAQLLACAIGLAGCDQGDRKSAPSVASSTGITRTTLAEGSNQKKALGIWLAADGSGRTLEFAADRVRVLKPDGGVISDAAYSVSKDEGNVLVIAPKDPNVVAEQFTFTDPDTFDMSRAEGTSSVATYKRKK